MPELKGRVAVVTGASSGVGRAIALGLAELGAQLCLIAREGEALEAVARSLRSDSVRVCCYQADFADDRDLQSLVESIQKNHEHIDILIHSAGIIELGRVDSALVSDLDLQYRVNLRAPYLLTQALLSTLRSTKGQIVFINSSVGMNARAGVGQYAATKHGLRALADSLREEVNPLGIRVLSVFLGRTASPMQKKVHQAEGRDYDPLIMMQPTDVASVVINALMLQRTAEITDVHIRPCRNVLETDGLGGSSQ